MTVRRVIQAFAAILLIFASVGTARAGFDDGLAAYRRADYGTALTEFLPLARNGLAAAQYNVALLYHHGLGVKADFKEALKWYVRAANNGCTEAQLAVGRFISEGVWGSPDFSAAAKWYRLAAEQGNAEAQRRLGILYLRGKGMARNTETAMVWLRRAENGGDGQARHLLPGLNHASPPPSHPLRHTQHFAKSDRCDKAIANDVHQSDLDYEVNVNFVFPTVTLDHTQSVAKMTRMDHARPGTRILGVTKQKGLTIKTQPRSVTMQVGNVTCFWLTGFDVTLRYQHVDVLVASDYPVGSCEYQAVLAHEAKHVRVARRNLEEYTSRIRSTLTSLLIPTSENPVVVDSPNQAREKVIALSRELLGPVYRDMLVSLRRGQKLIDTPQEYRRVASLCHHW